VQFNAQSGCRRDGPAKGRFAGCAELDSAGLAPLRIRPLGDEHDTRAKDLVGTGQRGSLGGKEDVACRTPGRFHAANREGQVGLQLADVLSVTLETDSQLGGAREIQLAGGLNHAMPGHFSRDSFGLNGLNVAWLWRGAFGNFPIPDQRGVVQGAAELNPDRPKETFQVVQLPLVAGLDAQFALQLIQHQAPQRPVGFPQRPEQAPALHQQTGDFQPELLECGLVKAAPGFLDEKMRA